MYKRFNLESDALRKKPDEFQDFDELEKDKEGALSPEFAEKQEIKSNLSFGPWRQKSLLKIERQNTKSEQGVCSRLTRCLGKKKETKYKETEPIFSLEFTEGDSDTEFEVQFKDLSKKDQTIRLQYLWHEAYIKSRAASHILTKFADLNNKIYMFGTRGDKKPVVKQ